MASVRNSKILVSLCLLMLFVVLPITAEKNISTLLWEENEYIANDTLKTPFIVNLTQNTLPNETFGYYLYQDIYFMRGYSNSCRIAAQYATDEKARQVLIEKGGKEEIYVQDLISYFKDLKLVYTPWKYPMNDAAKKYIKFMNDAAYNSTETTAYIFAALTPCTKLYYYLGKTINDSLTPEKLKSNKFRKWIEENAAAKGSAEKMDYYIDRLSKGLSKEKIHQIEKLYRKAMIHEIKFFKAAIREHDQIKLVVPLRMDQKGFGFSLVLDSDTSCRKSSINLDKLKQLLQSDQDGLVDIKQKNDGAKRLIRLYIGDSVDDFPCLSKADIGLIYNKSNELLTQVIKDYFSVNPVPLSANEGAVEAYNNVIYTFTDWDEVEAFIRGYKAQMTTLEYKVMTN